MPRPLASRVLAALVTSGLAAGLAVACSSESSPGGATDATLDTGAADDAAGDLGADVGEDTAPGDVGADLGADAPPDGGDAGPCAPPPAPPTTVLKPVPGELFYAQLALGGFSIGESAILVGPDGTVVVVDVGNDSHADDVAKGLTDVTGKARANHIVITHFHSDHGDGLSNLLGRITLEGKIVHRGFTDFTKAANDSTIASLCNALATRPGVGVGLCAAATTPPCAPGSWTGSYPATACPGLASADLALGSGATFDFVAANGFIGKDRYDTAVGPFLTSDSNGENARSVLSLVRHGAFQMLLAGDLTGGGSVTDDVESFFASRLPVDARGVDVLHASHHGRNTSSNATWVDKLLPSDKRSRNAVMGVSTAHVGSPHAEVLTHLLSGGRLGAGNAWTTRVAATGATAAGLIDAGGGRILVATLEGGAAYAVQALKADGSIVTTKTFRSVHACP